MPNLQFRPTIHTATGELIMELVSPDGRQLIGTIYPTPQGLKLVSKHITNHDAIAVIEPKEPRAVLINLERIKT